MTLDVVIPTWNASAILAKCLTALEAEKTPHTTIVVDNGSTDDTVEMVETQFPAVRLIALKENVGFGAAINRGVSAGDGETVVFLNNDAYVHPGFLDAISAPLHADDTVRMVSGVLLVAGTDLIDGAGVTIDRGLAGFAFMGGLPTSCLASPPGGLLGPSGGAAAFRRTAFHDAGGFDERIIAYNEDVDLALRVHAAGWRCAFAPDARADHLGSATLGIRTVRQVSVSARSRGYLLGRWRVGPVWVATELAVGLADCFVLRTAAPLTQRLRGFRAGRRLPAREVPAGPMDAAMSWWDSLRLRIGAVRGYERRHDRQPLAGFTHAVEADATAGLDRDAPLPATKRRSSSRM